MSDTATATRSASGVAPGGASSYRSYLTFDARPDAITLAVQQVSSWLQEKRYGDPDLTISGFTRLSDRTEMVVTHHQTKHAHSFRVRLAEDDPKGHQWVTSIAMHVPERGDGWLSLRVGHTGGTIARTPKIARYLIDVLELKDSGYQFAAGAPLIRTEGVDDLLDAVCDPDRNGLLFVATTDATDSDLVGPWTDRVAKWARWVHGLAQVVVLDPAASAAFNAGIGETHATHPWTIRTYTTDVDPAWAPDARRHRILGTQRLAKANDNAIAEILFRAAREHAATHQLPDSARSVIKDLNRVEDRLLLASLYDAATPTPVDVVAEPAPVTRPADQPDAPEAESAAGDLSEADTSRADAPESLPEITDQPHPDEQDHSRPGTSDADIEETEAPGSGGSGGSDVAAEVSEYLATISMVKETLGVEDLTEETLQRVIRRATQATEQAAERQAAADRVSRELQERQQRIDALEDQLSTLQAALDDAVMEHRLADDLRAKAEDEARKAHRALAQHGTPDVAWASLAEEPPAAPETFEELIERIPELDSQGVVFTGDPDITIDLGDQDTLGNIARAAWDCLLVLADYVAAKQSGDYSGNMKQYLLNTPPGYRTLPRKRFGEKESGSTLDQWADDRVFPVPTDVDDDGEILMEAHFKLPHCGMVTPRIHYYDHTHASGKIYVGYIGPHLRTKATN